MARFAQPIPADKLQRAMAVRGLTPQLVAEEAGVGKATVSRAMNGHRVTLETLFRISEVLARFEVRDDLADLLTPEKPTLRVVERGA